MNKVRAYLGQHRHPGLQAYVTGPGGIAADLEQVADDAGKTLLIATLGLVLLLLLVVYRAPVLALLPLLTVGTAYLIAIGIAYLLIEAGLISGQRRGHDPAAGAGLRRRHRLLAAADPPLPRGARRAAWSGRRRCREALAQSVRPIAASAGTVIAAMLVLLLADLESTHWLGPVLAIGIAVMLAAALTLLPAVLWLLGGRAFWPGAGPTRRAAPPLGAGRRRGASPAAYDRRRRLRRARSCSRSAT